MMFNTSNSLNDIGFLSPDIDAVIADLRKQHANWFVFAHDLNRTGQRILAEFKPSGSVPIRDVVGIALLMRTLSNFQGTILMAERGMVVEAGTLARCCFENAFVVGTLAKEGDSFLDELQMAHEFSDKQMARWLVTVPARLEYAPAGAKRKLEERINEIAKRIPGFKPTDYRALAGRAGLDGAHVIYAALSRDAAHPSAQSLDRYFVRGRGEYPLQAMRWGAYASEPDAVPLTLSMACLAVMEVCERMCEMLRNADALNEVKAHRSVHDKLNGGEL